MKSTHHPALEAATRLAGEIGERPLGTARNREAQEYLRCLAGELGFAVEELPISCHRWEAGASCLRFGSTEIPIFPGPFSPPHKGELNVEVAESVDDLRNKGLSDTLLLIRGDLAEEPLMPKEFPFYYPEEHREIIDLLQRRAPAAILALTGKHPLCGLDPYPLFEDGNLNIPNAYARAADFDELSGSRATVEINSSAVAESSFQPLFSREGTISGRIVVCAHLDTKYGTPGALDNAAGVATLLGVMKRLSSATPRFSLDFVPFNGEEQYEVPGQLAYLAYRNPSTENTRLVVNLDALGHRDSANAFSSYNLADRDEERLRRLLEQFPRSQAGEPWIAGDHAIFAFQGIPSLAVTSSNLEETVLGLTHTDRDELSLLDGELLEESAEVVARLLAELEY